jgi:hypothetical protein
MFILIIITIIIIIIIIVHRLVQDFFKVLHSPSTVKKCIFHCNKKIRRKYIRVCVCAPMSVYLQMTARNNCNHKHL